MAGAVDTIERLHRALAHLDAIEDTDLAWLTEALRQWLAGAPWEAAIGLGNGWREYLSQRQRHATLVALLAALPVMTCRAAATEIARQLSAYASTSWPRDRDAGRRPPGDRGLLFDYLLTNGPISAERLRKLLPNAG